MILLFCVGVPLFGAFLLPAIGKRSAVARQVSALALVLTTLILACCTAGLVLSGSAPSIKLEVPLGLSFGLRSDALSVFMAITSVVVASIIVIYSFGYMKEFDHLNEYYMMVVFFIGAMMGLVFSTNLIEIYVFWECSSFCCWRLIGFYRDPLCIQKADKAFIVTVLGALVMLLGFIGVYGTTGTFDITAMKGAAIPSWTVALILCGILSKSATFPLHNWLPDAGVAPSPVTSLLHAAVLVKIGVYVYARLFCLTFVTDPVFNVIVPTIAAVSAIISAGCALVATDIKRVVAYSTISQLAFILLGLSAGTEVGLVGGLLYIMAHSVAKAGLFLCCGIVEHNMHTKDMTKMGGLIKTMPKTAFAYILCAFSVMGIPPFAGFFAKDLVIEGIVDAGHPILAAVFIIGAIMTIMYLLRLFILVFLGPQKGKPAHEHSATMVGSVVALGVIALLLGLAIMWPSGLAEMVLEAI